MIIIPKLDQIKLLDIFSFMDVVGNINNKIVSNDTEMDQNSSKKQNGLKKKVKTKSMIIIPKFDQIRLLDIFSLLILYVFCQ